MKIKSNEIYERLVKIDTSQEFIKEKVNKMDLSLDRVEIDLARCSQKIDNHINHHNGFNRKTIGAGVGTSVGLAGIISWLMQYFGQIKP